MTDDTYRIYQVKHIPFEGDSYDLRRDVAFSGLESLAQRGLEVNPDNYGLVYTGKLESWMTPENLFQKFNLDIPADFYGHSMSVSDVVVFVKNGEETAYFCDSMGFAKLDRFTTPESPPTPPTPKKSKPPKKKGGNAR